MALNDVSGLRLDWLARQTAPLSREIGVIVEWAQGISPWASHGR